MAELIIEIPEATPMFNQYVRWHWRKQRKHTETMAWLIRKAVGVQYPKTHAPIKKCIVVIERHKGPSATGKYPKQDWDGLIGGLKGVLDALTATHKHGVGIIEDDSTDCIVATPTMIPVKAPKCVDKTVIKIIEVD